MNRIYPERRVKNRTYVKNYCSNVNDAPREKTPRRVFPLRTYRDPQPQKDPCPGRGSDEAPERLRAEARRGKNRTYVKGI